MSYVEFAGDKAYWMNPPDAKGGDECAGRCNVWNPCLLYINRKTCLNPDKRRRLILPGTDSQGRACRILRLEDYLPAPQFQSTTDGINWADDSKVGINTVEEYIKTRPYIIAIRTWGDAAFKPSVPIESKQEDGFKYCETHGRVYRYKDDSNAGQFWYNGEWKESSRLSVSERIKVLPNVWKPITPERALELMSKKDAVTETISKDTVKVDLDALATDNILKKSRESVNRPPVEDWYGFERLKVGQDATEIDEFRYGNQWKKCVPQPVCESDIIRRPIPRNLGERLMGLDENWPEGKCGRIVLGAGSSHEQLPFTKNVGYETIREWFNARPVPGLAIFIRDEKKDVAQAVAVDSVVGSSPTPVERNTGDEICECGKPRSEHFGVNAIVHQFKPKNGGDEKCADAPVVVPVDVKSTTQSASPAPASTARPEPEGSRAGASTFNNRSFEGFKSKDFQEWKAAAYMNSQITTEGQKAFSAGYKRGWNSSKHFHSLTKPSPNWVEVATGLRPEAGEFEFLQANEHWVQWEKGRIVLLESEIENWFDSHPNVLFFYQIPNLPTFAAPPKPKPVEDGETLSYNKIWDSRPKVVEGDDTPDMIEDLMRQMYRAGHAARKQKEDGK